MYPMDFYPLFVQQSCTFKQNLDNVQFHFKFTFLVVFNFSIFLLHLLFLNRRIITGRLMEDDIQLHITKTSFTIPSFTYVALVRISLLKEAKPMDGGDIRALWSVHAHTYNKACETCSHNPSRLWEPIWKAGAPSVSRGFKTHWKKVTVWEVTSCKHTHITYPYSSSPEGSKPLTRTADEFGRVVLSGYKTLIPTLPRSCISCWARDTKYWASEIQVWNTEVGNYSLTMSGGFF